MEKYNIILYIYSNNYIVEDLTGFSDYHFIWLEPFTLKGFYRLNNRFRVELFRLPIKYHNSEREKKFKHRYGTKGSVHECGKHSRFWNYSDSKFVIVTIPLKFKKISLYLIHNLNVYICKYCHQTSNINVNKGKEYTKFLPKHTHESN